MKKFIRHFVSFFLVAVMIVSSNITAFAANEKPVDSRFLPEITYTEDNTSTTRVPNLIPITVNPYYNPIFDSQIYQNTAESLILPGFFSGVFSFYYIVFFLNQIWMIDFYDFSRDCLLSFWISFIFLLVRNS